MPHSDDLRELLLTAELITESSRPNSSHQYLVNCFECDSRKMYIDAGDDEDKVGLAFCQKCSAHANYKQLVQKFGPQTEEQKVYAIFHEYAVRQLLKNKSALKGLIDERDFTEEDIATFGYGYVGKDFIKDLAAKGVTLAQLKEHGFYSEKDGKWYPVFWNHVIIPYRRNGKYENFKGRNLDENARIKYIGLSGKEAQIYGESDLHKAGRKYLTEGEFKRDYATANGYNCSGISGAGNAGKFIKRLRMVDDLWIVLDADAPTEKFPLGCGQENAIKIAEQLDKCHVVFLPLLDGKKTGLDDYLRINSPDEFDELCEGAEYYAGGEKQKSQSLAVIVQDWKRQAKSITESTGLDIGFPRLNEVLHGAMPGSLAYAIGAPHNGKGHPLSTRILTPWGWERVGSLTTGGLVIGSNGKATKITAIYERGMLDVYRVTMNDHSSVLVDGEHLWNVQTRKQRASSKKWQTVSTLALASDDLYVKRSDGNKGAKWFIPMVAPVEYAPLTNVVDPYVLGTMIANGCFYGTPCISLNTNDRDVAKRILSNPGARETSQTTAIRILVSGITQNIKSLGLSRVKSADKFIPGSYKYASVGERVSLLQGLMDCDGSLTPYGQAIYSTISNKLSLDLQELVEGLGGTAYICAVERKGNIEYQLTLTLPEGIDPFFGVRKRSKFRRHRLPHRSIKSIEYVGKEEVRCIKVEATDQLYVTERFIVTHNTALLRAIALNTYRFNENCHIKYYTNDDSLKTTIGHVVAMIGELNSTDAKEPMVAYANNKQMMRQWEQATRELEAMSNRFTLLDRGYKVSLEDIREDLMRWREKNPDGEHAVFIDGFSKIYSVAASKVDNERQQLNIKSDFLKQMAQQADVFVMSTIEPPKLYGRRPQSFDIANSAMGEFDADIVMSCYIDALVNSIEGTELKQVVEYSDETVDTLPIIEVKVHKNKQTGNQLLDLFILHKGTSTLEELEDTDYNRMSKKVIASQLGTKKQ